MSKMNDSLNSNMDLGNSFFRVCVVEDDLELSTVLERVLRSIDPHVQIDWATSAEDALVLLKNSSSSKKRGYDLVIADIYLEGEATGLDIWHYCQDRLPEVPLVVTSGLGLEKFLRSVGTQSISPPFLSKPFLPGECKQVLEGQLAYSPKARFAGGATGRVATASSYQ